MYRMKNNRLALEALPQASTQQTLFFSVFYKMALPEFLQNLPIVLGLYCVPALALVFLTVEEAS